MYPNGKDNHILNEIRKHPTAIKDLTNIAKRLASQVPLDLVRVDVYWHDNKWFGGEITLTPEGGTATISCNS